MSFLVPRLLWTMYLYVLSHSPDTVGIGARLLVFKVFINRLHEGYLPIKPR